MKNAIIQGPRRFRGEVSVPGDKSITHRALIVGALAKGETVIHRPLAGLDCKATAAAVERMGAKVKRVPGKPWRVTGTGPQGFAEPDDVLDAGNSGTSIRLLAGAVAGHPITAFFTGDASIRRRPMKRVLEPLAAMGARVLGSFGDTRAPFGIRGGALTARAHHLPVASAQVKSAILFAGLRAAGKTTVHEPAGSRDHTERMLLHIGAALAATAGSVSIQGGTPLEAREVWVPADISSAAFLVVGALGAPGSSLRLPEVGVNPTRTGLLAVARRMGCEVRAESEREAAGEPIADLVVRAASGPSATEIGGEEIPALVDEVPILALLATRAAGTTRIGGAGELKVKESDRLAGTAALLSAFGARVQATDDGLVIEGGGDLKPAHVESGGDHRLAMTAAIAACWVNGETIIDDVACVETSFPGFFELLEASTELVR